MERAHWPVFIARGYAFAQLCFGLILAYTTLRLGSGLTALARALEAQLLGEADALSQIVLLGGTIAFLALLGAAATLLFLASGLWRYREWARHGVLVLAIVSIPVLAALPFAGWLFTTGTPVGSDAAGFASLADLAPALIPVTILGIAFCLGTVYFFAYRPEVIELYLPRPHLRRGAHNAYVYVNTPLPPTAAFSSTDDKPASPRARAKKK